MAILNSKEKLIQEAAKGEDAFLKLVFKRFIEHFTAESEAPKKQYDDCSYIDYLYCQDHEIFTFQKIADDILHIGLSTLEERRAIYISIFYYYLKIEKAEREAAITKHI